MNPSQRTTVLLVEDDEIDVENFHRVMKREDISNPIVVATDGIYALEKLRGINSSKVPKPYVIMLDLNMPRMGGIEFLREIRADSELCDSTVFVLTTSSSKKDIDAASDFNIAGYLIKDELGSAYSRKTGMLDQFCKVVNLPH